MRELVTENQEIIMIPQRYQNSRKGKVVDVSAIDFTMEVEDVPKDIMLNTFCEFYTMTSHGKLYFDSYVKKISGNKLVVASPAKHKFLQRRQYTRIKYVHEVEIFESGTPHKILTLDISAGGMKFETQENLNLEGIFDITIPISDNSSIKCNFSPIRIEKKADSGYTVSGQFKYSNGHDKMMLTQYCAKASFEIKNK